MSIRTQTSLAKSMFILLIFISCTTLVFYTFLLSYALSFTSINESSASNNASSKFGSKAHTSKNKTLQTHEYVKYTVLHIDLKKMPPKLKFLESMLTPLSTIGVNGLLIDYGDMFPYDGPLAYVTSELHYTRHELMQFLFAAASIGMKVIPLIPTLNDMGFVLKLKGFEHLRENQTNPNLICPCKQESLELIEEMIRQYPQIKCMSGGTHALLQVQTIYLLISSDEALRIIMIELHLQVTKFHSLIVRVQYIHIGYGGVSESDFPSCKDKFVANTDLYISHVLKIADIVKRLSYASVLFERDVISMNKYMKKNDNPLQINAVYNLPDDLDTLHNGLQHKTFPNIWVTTDLRRHDDNNPILPDVLKSTRNTYDSMTSVMNLTQSNRTINGVILMNRSNSSELVVGLKPTLFIDSYIISLHKTGRRGRGMQYENLLKYVIGTQMTSLLRCYPRLRSSEPNFSSCRFAGNQLYTALHNLEVFIIDSLKKSNETREFIKNGETKEFIKNGDEKNKKISLEWCNTLVTLTVKVKTIMKAFYEKELIEDCVVEKLRPINSNIALCTEFLNKVEAVTNVVKN